MPRYLINLTCGLILSIAYFGCSGKSENNEANEKVYARVNDAKLTESSLQALVPKDFYDKLTAEHKKEIISEWVNNELLYQEALRQKIDKNPEIARIIENSKRTLLSNELLESSAENANTPSEKDMRKYYEEHKDNFVLQSSEYKVRYALFEEKKKADYFWKKVKGKADFSELAKEESKDPSAPKGGDIGIINEESVDPQIWRAIIDTVSKYGLGKISNPFKVSDGWACVIVDDKSEAGGVKPFEKVRDQILDIYSVEKREEARSALLKKLAANAKIKYY
ncbi:MAG: peptidyl-prolyl cis-trans isomerase [Candidatus Latescibacterota bacterium]